MASSERLDRDFLDCMNDTITVLPESTYDDFGEEQHDESSSRVVKCIVQGSNRVIRNVDQTTVKIMFDIYADDIDIKPEDRIKMSDDTDRTIQTILTYSDELGKLYQVIGVL